MSNDVIANPPLEAGWAIDNNPIVGQPETTVETTTTTSEILTTPNTSIVDFQNTSPTAETEQETSTTTTTTSTTITSPQSSISTSNANDKVVKKRNTMAQYVGEATNYATDKEMKKTQNAVQQGRPPGYRNGNGD